MKQSLFDIVENTALTRDVYKMRLVGDTSDITASGQFVNIKLDGLYLRRPISVCDCEGDTAIIASSSGILKTAFSSFSSRSPIISVS